MKERLHTESPVKEFGLALASILFFFLAGTYLPVIGLALFFLTPVPIILFIYRQGINNSLWLVGAAMAVIFFLSGSLFGLGALADFGAIAFCLSYYQAKGDDRAYALLKTALVSLLVVYLFASLTVRAGGGNFDQIIRKQIDFSVSEAIRLYDSMKLPAEQKIETTNYLLTMKEVFKNIYWGLFASLSLAVVLFNDLMGKMVLRKVYHYQFETPSFSLFAFPDVLVWGFITSAALWFLKVPSFGWIGVNAAILFIMMYLLQGMAVLFFILGKKKIPVFSKVLGGLLLAFQPILLFLVAAMGIFDIWFDFRKIRGLPTADNH